MPDSAGRPRIAYVLKRFPRFSETFILNELLAHEEAGAEVHVFSLRRPPEEPRHARLAELKAGVTLLDRCTASAADRILPSEEPLFSGKGAAEIRVLLAQARTLARLAAERGISHLHAHFASDATTVAAIAAARMDGRFSFTAHARDIYHTYATPREDAAMRRAKLRAAAFAATVSDTNAQYLRRLCPEARVLRLYNGIDLRTFAPADPAGQRAGGLVAVGRLVPKKGFDVLIDACALLRQRGVPFHLSLIGSGPMEEQLLAAIARYRLREVVALEGPLPQERLIGRMAKAQAAVLPCVVTESGDRDGLPTVLLEAMACALPVVTTTVGGGPEIVEHGRTGLLCAPGDPIELADALECLLSQPAEARRMGEAGRARAERLFDLRQNAACLRRLLERPELALTGEAA